MHILFFSKKTHNRNRLTPNKSNRYFPYYIEIRLSEKIKLNKYYINIVIIIIQINYIIVLREKKIFTLYR